MKRCEPESVGDVLRQTLHEEGMTERLYETRAAALWPAIVGEEIASLSTKPFVAGGIMTVRIAVPSLRQELNMSRTSLIKIINDSLRREVIKDIRFR